MQPARHHGCERTSLPAAARAKESCVAKVLLPTPPFPDSTRILWRTLRSLSSISAISVSGPLGAEAQAAWLGHPAQLAALPACSLCVPGQSAQQDHDMHEVISYIGSLLTGYNQQRN